ncbi:Uncharacterised protein [Mycolicibacterium vanbaalenii]|uniref:DUF732 domain-containing protein n=1 Tax=Mycolicibacterium vanbaalenii TaxID=110539 RepID=A0A5S9QFX8_MYCVN|nr:DUF732 domain-containing protein [Mycolicibacterium vanbaalenii]CAA0117460.1 Uncharacterised protein [Mycolicibacterium vanbaalenii]
MISDRRAVAAAMVAAGFSLFVAAAPAHADTPDERFTQAVNTLGIQVAPDTDLPAVGKQVCGMFASQVVTSVNPVPAVRGVVTTLQDSGINRDQAVGLMRASVGIYCPQYARFIGR